MKQRLNQLSKLYHWLVQPLLVFAILAIGFFGAEALTLFKQEAPQNQPANYAPLVKTIRSEIGSRTLKIRGTGTIQPRTQINIVPQVGGRIVYIHTQLRAGGYFQAEQTLLEIEAIDYQLAVTDAESQVAGALRNQQLEQAEAEAAIEEWRALHGDEPVPVLVGRKPQIAEAKANLQAAKSRLQQARINLERTRISMPFPGRIVEATIDIGEVVNANQAVGSVYASELLEIPVPLEIEQLAWLRLPHPDKPEQAPDTLSSAEILLTLAGRSYRLNGRIIRVESQLDRLSRLARVVISLEAKDIPPELREEVIPGLFVNVEINATELDNISVLPRSVLRENAILWTVKNEQLQFVKTNIIFQSDSEIWLRELPAGTTIVSSSLDVVTENMQVRVQP